MYLQTVAFFSKLTLILSREPAMMAAQMSARSVCSNGITFIASGSPSLALISTSLTPAGVNMNWPYRMPLYSAPSALAASTNLRKMSRAAS